MNVQSSNISRDFEVTPRLGSLTTIEALKLQGFLPRDTKYMLSMPDFDGKRVWDVGAGISDFLKLISQYSKTQELVAVDPIYRDIQTYERSLKVTKTLLESYIYQIRNQAIRILNSRSKTDAAIAAVLRSYFKLKDRKRLLLEAKFQSEFGIQYTPYLDDRSGKKADYIFVTFLLYLHPQPEHLLSQVYSCLDDGGELVITDFRYRGVIRKLREGNTGYIKILGEDYTGGFCSIAIKKEDIFSLQLQ